MRVKKDIIPMLIISVAIILPMAFLGMRGWLNGSFSWSRGLQIFDSGDFGDSLAVEKERNLSSGKVSAFTTEDGRMGLGIFAADGSGYRLQETVVVNSGDAVLTSVTLDETAYDLFWANREDLDRAEFRYYVNGELSETIELDASDNVILAYESPGGECAVKVTYWDRQGNVYEL